MFGVVVPVMAAEMWWNESVIAERVEKDGLSVAVCIHVRRPTAIVATIALWFGGRVARGTRMQLSWRTTHSQNHNHTASSTG